jgi:hypothetical protein
MSCGFNLSVCVRTPSTTYKAGAVVTEATL